MSLKFKLLSTISFICLAIVLTFVGVYALTDLNFSVGGDITYTAPTGEQQGYAVNFEKGIKQASIFEINVYINDEKVLTGDQSVLWDKSFTDVYEVKIEVRDCMGGTLEFLGNDGTKYSTTWDTLIIKITKDIVFTVSAK